MGMEDHIICPYCGIRFSETAWEYADVATLRCWNCDEKFGLITKVVVSSYKMEN